MRKDRTVRGVAVLGLTLLLWSLAPTGAEAQIRTAAGFLRKTIAKEARSLEETDSSLFVNVPNMAVTFTSTVTGPLLVTFCANVLAEGDDMRLRAKLDGNRLAPPGADDEIFASQDFGFRCQTWIAAGVPAGQHTVRIRWRSSGAAGISMAKRLLTVQYSK